MFQTDVNFYPSHETKTQAATIKGQQYLVTKNFSHCHKTLLLILTFSVCLALTMATSDKHAVHVEKTIVIVGLHRNDSKRIKQNVMLS